MDDLGDLSEFRLIDIKSEGVSKEHLDEMKSAHGGNYSDFFSRRAMKYRAMGLNERELSEGEIADLITSEYTFLKRPVLQIDNKIFIGNSKKVVEAAKKALNE